MSRQRSLETIQTAELVTIGELVRLTGTRYSTLKYYTEEGMLPFQQAGENLTRRYARKESLERIRLIKTLREAGRSIPQVKQILSDPASIPPLPPQEQPQSEEQEGEAPPVEEHPHTHPG